MTSTSLFWTPLLWPETHIAISSLALGKPVPVDLALGVHLRNCLLKNECRYNLDFLWTAIELTSPPHHCDSFISEHKEIQALFYVLNEMTPRPPDEIIEFVSAMEKLSAALASVCHADSICEHERWGECLDWQDRAMAKLEKALYDLAPFVKDE